LGFARRLLQLKYCSPPPYREKELAATNTATSFFLYTYLSPAANRRAFGEHSTHLQQFEKS
jgi:hypothetical protein